MAVIKTDVENSSQKSGDLFQQVVGLIVKMQGDMQKAFVEMAARVELMVDGAKAQMGGGSTHGGEGCGSGSGIGRKLPLGS